jgi:hypothetical protein
MTMDTHLTEEQRQSLADGSLSAEQRASAAAHVADCSVCGDDVARLTTLMKRIHETPAPDAPFDDLWPEIRARIEQTKVVPLAGSGTREAGRGTREAGSGRRMRWFVSTGAVAAAAIITVLALRDRPAGRGDSSLVSAGDTTTLVAVVDSAHAYEAEARILLDKLELRRAMLRPEAAQALDRDLRVVDVAIAELKDAVARDPNNPALRRLLASSYRQKVDLLKRVANAS